MNDPDSDESSPDDYRRTARCERCKVSPGLCVCDRIPHFTLAYRFLVIRHGFELDKQSNTGSMIPELIAGSQVSEWGFKPRPFDPTLLEDPAAEYYVLFPVKSGTALARDQIVPRPGRVPTFILLDATWRQARRMRRRIPNLVDLPFFTLPEPTEDPERVLRRSPAPGHLSTLGAAVRTVEVMGDLAQAAQLGSFMDLLYRRILQTRSKLPPEDPAAQRA